MPSPAKRSRAGSIRQVQQALQRMEADPTSQIGGLGDQSPIGSASPATRASPPRTGPIARKPKPSPGLWSDLKTGRWITNPASSFVIMLIPIITYINWEITAPLLKHNIPNPTAPLIFISHPTPSAPGDPRYRKGWLDLVFISYYIVVWSFVRQFITVTLCRPLAHRFGIRKEGKVDRFGEQGYAVIYFAFFGLWGYRVMGQLPTWWYDTKNFWIDYPHWEMKPELKAYYLVQAAYWCQQLIVMVFRLEKPRSDHNILVAHHIVTLWLIGWSYLVNLTLIGHAVYMSMDIPDCFLAFTKVFNYMKKEIPKVFAFVFLMGTWTYFRHWLNIKMLWSVWYEFDLLPETAKRWSPEDGVWLAPWMRYQIFIPLLLLKFLNIFWYFLICRIAVRAVVGVDIDDDRSDDEGDNDEPENDKED